MNPPKLKTIIVDDEPGCISNLNHYISKYCPRLEVVATGNTPDQIRSAFNTRFDLAFLDIELYEDNIFDVLSTVEKHDFDIVFVSAYEKYALRAFKVNAIDYILKPLSQADIQGCYEKIMKKADSRHHDDNDAGISQPSKKIVLKQGDNVFVIKPDDIYYLKAKGFYTEIYFESKGVVMSLLLSKPISVVEKEYGERYFFRLHKSYLVNTKKVINITRNEHSEVRLANNQVLPIAKRRVNEFLTFFNGIAEV